MALGLTDEVLLAGRAHKVRIGVAEAHVIERLLPAKHLVSGLDVDLGVLSARRKPSVGVVVAVVNIDIDTAQTVDCPLKSAEVDFNDVVDVNSEQVADRRER